MQGGTFKSWAFFYLFFWKNRYLDRLEVIDIIELLWQWVIVGPTFTHNLIGIPLHAGIQNAHREKINGILLKMSIWAIFKKR